MSGGLCPASVGVLVYEGVDELDVFGAYAGLRKAAELGGELDVCLVGCSEVVTASAGTSIEGVEHTGIMPSLDALVVPGGRGAATASAVTYADELRAWDSLGRPTYSICTGLLLLTGTGLYERADRVAFPAAKAGMLPSGPVKQLVNGVCRSGLLTSTAGPVVGGKGLTTAVAVVADLAPGVLNDLLGRIEHPGLEGTEHR